MDILRYFGIFDGYFRQGRETIKIVPPHFLMEKGGQHYLQKENIVKGYILRRDAEEFSSR